MTISKERAKYTIASLFLATLAGCSGAGEPQEYEGNDAELSLSEPEAEGELNDRMTLQETPNGAPRADATIQPQSPLGTARQGMIKLQCCECTSDSGGVCHAVKCGPCQDL